MRRVVEPDRVVIRVAVIRWPAVRTPMPAILAGLRIEDHHPPIAVSIRDEHFVRTRIGVIGARRPLPVWISSKAARQ